MKYIEGNIVGFGETRVKAAIDHDRRKRRLVVKPHIEFVPNLQEWHVFSPLADEYGNTMMAAWNNYQRRVYLDSKRLFQHMPDSFLTALPEFPTLDDDRKDA